MAEDIYVSAVEGNSQYLDGGAMFGSVPRVLWEKWHEYDKLGRIELATRGLLIECQGILILCEAGIGNFFPPHLAERYGVSNPSENRLLTSLDKLGVEPGEIDYVILSHLHFDHVGGLLTKSGDLNFPKAKYVVGERAFARACQPHFRDRASFIKDLPKKLRDSGRLILVDTHKIAGILEERLEFIFTEGHTVGQMHTVFKGNKGKIFFAGDLIPGVAWVHLPVTAGYDRFPENLIDEKKALYEKMSGEKWHIFYMHDIKVKASRVKYENGKYSATELLTSLGRYPL